MQGSISNFPDWVIKLYADVEAETNELMYRGHLSTQDVLLQLKQGMILNVSHKQEQFLLSISKVRSITLATKVF